MTGRDPVLSLNRLFLGHDPVAHAIALKLTNAIKVKCTQEECLSILREIPDDDPEQTVNPTRVSNMPCLKLQ